MMSSSSIQPGQLFWGEGYVPGLHEVVMALEPDVEMSVSSGLDCQYWRVWRAIHAISASEWGYTCAGFTSMHEGTLGDFYTLVGSVPALKKTSGTC